MAGDLAGDGARGAGALAELSLEQRRAIALARARQRVAAAPQTAHLKRLEQAFRKAHEAGNTEDARRLAAAIRAARAPQQPQTGLVEQGLSGVNEGIAGILGAPVDLMTAGLNAGVSGINSIAGTEIQPIENPVGGSGTFLSLMAPTISDVEPQTTGQRYARRIGKEAGAMAVPGLGMAGRAARPAQLGMMEAASALGAGAAGQTVEEMGGGQTAQDIAAIAAGITPAGVSRAVRPRPRAPSMDEVRADRDAAYLRVDQSGAQLTPDARDETCAGSQ